jgi:Raf kinase inhibitor-like YbhB/YbcL family protein
MAATLRVESPAFRDGASIPDVHTCDGGDVLPPLVVHGVPAGTATLAVIFDDPDSPSGTWVHWLLWDLPARHAQWDAGADLTRLGAVQGRTTWKDRPPAYYGPCPGRGTHRYFFRVFAVDTVSGLPSGADRAALERALDGHVLASGTLMGRYVRRENRRA